MLLLTATACTDSTADTQVPRRFEARVVDEAVHRPCGEPTVARRGELRRATCAEADRPGVWGEPPLDDLSPLDDEAFGEADPVGHLAHWLPSAPDAQALRREISSLESTSGEPDPRRLTALGALYHALALATGDARHLVDAYEQTAHALELAPESPAALFNRALVASDLGLCHQAREGFRAYLDVDGESDWAVEARMRRAALPCGPGAAVEETHDDLFEEAIEELLPAWAETWPEDREAADGLLDEIAALGERLAREAGDPWVSEVVVELRGADARQVEGVRACTEGRALYDGLHWQDAGPVLRAGRRRLPNDSAFVAWCDVWIAGIQIAEGDREVAVESLARHRRDPRILASPMLSGRVHWSSGLAASRGDGLETARGLLATSRDALTRGAYHAHAGAVRTLESEALLNLGFVVESWRVRAAALRQLQAPEPVFALHNGLLSGARATSLRGAFRTAQALLDEAGAIEEEPSDEVEVSLSRGDARLRAGDEELAAQAYAYASSLLVKVEEATVRDRLAARVEVGLRSTADDDTRPGLAPLDGALDYYAKHGPVWREIEALRVAALTGDPAGVEPGLQAALRRVREIEAEIDDRSLGFTYWESIQSVYDEALDWTWTHRDPWQALDLLEEARRPGGRSGVTRRFVCAPRHAVDGDPVPVVLALGVFGDRIVWWRLDGDDCRAGVSDRATVQQALSHLLSQAPTNTVEPGLLETLHRELLAEPLRGVAADRPLVLVPDRFLLQVPFAALLDAATGRHVIEDRPVSYRLTVEDAWVPRVSRRPRTSWHALVVGDPHFDRRVQPEAYLPFAATEARQVAALYDGRSRLLLQEDATVANVRAALPDSQVVHLAGHVVPASDGSGDLLLLAEDPAAGQSGLATSAELLEDVSASFDLVVLSACSTLGGTPSRSGGLVGAAQPFVARGTPAVVGTLWAVPDDSLGPMMASFHAHLRDGLPASQALRQAQIETLRTEDPPFAWASLQLVGDVGSPSAIATPSTSTRRSDAF
jgi:CHAT domain-containing protein/tetratricopeptide (TPR) repeat protein